MFSLNTGGGKSKLASIEYLDEEQDVYDFYVPEGNEYIANGIASHNTAMAVNVLRNMTEFALEDCCIVPLEMTATQTLDRLAGILSGQDVNKISQKRLSPGEKTVVKNAYKKYVKTLKENKSVYSIYEPPEDVTIEEVLLTLKPRGYKVILIDYISLLKGADGDDQWKQLGRIARFAKVFAKNNNCIVVLLCQVSEEGKIRYANAIAEHCFTADTWIDTPAGPRQIVSFVGEHAKEFHGKASFPVTTENHVGIGSAVHYNGVKPVYTLTLADGTTSKSTNTHKFKVLRPDLTVDWVPLKDVRIGDYVAQNIEYAWPKTLQSLPTFVRNAHHNAVQTKVPTRMTEAMGYFIGGMLSDGYVNDDKLEWVTVDRDSALDFDAKAHTLFGGACKLRECKTRSGKEVWRVQLHQKDAIAAVQAIDGMLGGSRGKYIPDLVMQSPKKVVVACLRGMFDGDGSAVKGQVYYTTWSHEMATRLHLLLQRLGIRSRISKPNEGYRVTITGANNIKVFSDTVGFVARRKTLMLERVLSNVKPIEQKVPFVSEVLLAKGRADLAHGVSAQWHNDKKPGYAHGCVRSRLPWLLKQTEQVHDKAVIRQLMDFDWCEVTDIAYSGKEPVYDITVDGTHSYVANGMIAHNSNNAWIWTLPGEESETSIMDIKQLKARNQLRFNFQLISHNSSMRITDLDDGPESESDGDGDQSENKTGYNVQDGNKNESSKLRKGKGTGRASKEEDEPFLKDLNDGDDEEDDEDEDD